MGKRPHRKHFSRCSTRNTFAAIACNIYNDLPEVTSLFKIFADDTSLFPKAIKRKHSKTELNKDLALISALIIYESSVRPFHDYANIMYNKPFNHRALQGRNPHLEKQLLPK